MGKCRMGKCRYGYVSHGYMSPNLTRNNQKSLALVLRVEEPEEEILDLEIVDIEIC